MEQNKLEQIAAPLLAWYDGNRRILPWREDPTPYRVWISEIMLQQTRVEAVKPYFDRFQRELPDVESLALVEEERLLKLWEGLGYYNRARNLKKAAIQVMEEHGGKLPGDYAALLKLPGIGSYTAGAIASIAFQIPVPAVDGNVLRVISRLRTDEADILEPAVKKRVEAELLAIMPKDRPGDMNQALMELGATVCIPNGAPKCEGCPWNPICEANAKGCQQDFPKKTPKKPRKIEQKTILVIQDGKRAAIRKRPSRGLLAGLYEFPSLEGHKSMEEITLYLKEQGLQPLRLKPLEASRHIFTHIEWDMIGYAVRVDELEPIKKQKNTLSEEVIFLEPGETQERYPIPTAFGAYTKYLDIRQGNARFE